MKRKLKQIRCNLPIEVVADIEAYTAEQDMPFSIAVEKLITIALIGAGTDGKTKESK